MVTELGELWTAYEWEVHRREVLVDPMGRGFMTYGVQERGLWIAEVYVKPFFRKQGVARAMLEQVEEVARAAGLEFIYGTLDASTETWRDSLVAQEAVGFRLQAVEGRNALLVKVVGSRPGAVEGPHRPALPPEEER